MTAYEVFVQASKTGALALYTERRTYVIESPSEERSIITQRAIERAYAEGLEHVLVCRIVPLEEEA